MDKRSWRRNRDMFVEGGGRTKIDCQWLYKSYYHRKMVITRNSRWTTFLKIYVTVLKSFINVCLYKILFKNRCSVLFKRFVNTTTFRSIYSRFHYFYWLSVQWCEVRGTMARWTSHNWMGKLIFIQHVYILYIQAILRPQKKAKKISETRMNM